MFHIWAHFAAKKENFLSSNDRNLSQSSFRISSHHSIFSHSKLFRWQSENLFIVFSPSWYFRSCCRNSRSVFQDGSFYSLLKFTKGTPLCGIHTMLCLWSAFQSLEYNLIGFSSTIIIVPIILHFTALRHMWSIMALNVMHRHEANHFPHIKAMKCKTTWAMPTNKIQPTVSMKQEIPYVVGQMVNMKRMLNTNESFLLPCANCASGD